MNRFLIRPELGGGDRCLSAFSVCVLKEKIELGSSVLMNYEEI